MVENKEIPVDNELARNILTLTLDIVSNRFILFINHWKSKRGPESMRTAYAKKLKREIDKLKENIDFILIGDFNSNYNEYKTFRNSGRLNDTNGITGINHILGTIKDSEMVNEKILTKQAANEYLYNLWLEVSKTGRWSYNFFGEKGSPDNIIVSKGLYDDKGISYIDNSFNKFQPDYLFKRKAIYRWQMVESGRGKHLGEGYSDHLPIFAYFSTEPFSFKNNDTVSNDIAPLKLEKTESPQGLIDLNTATEKELQSIKGIGPVLTKRIIAGRPYRTVDDLNKVKGIGPKTIENIQPYIVIRPE
jgi:competence ComEA-like helix-hairpin-helix protein